jgi:CPA1 family monovalent cation:H+ antiporter
MDIIDIIAILITFSALFSYFNYQYFHLPRTIGLMLSALILASELTRKNLDTFWELIDEVLNALLFILIGLEVLALEFRLQHLMAGLILIPLVLLARMISVGVPFSLLSIRRSYGSNAVKVLTWGGLRGGIAVALALSLPSGPARGGILAVTYMVVVFSIAVQGLTIGELMRRWKTSD